MRRSREAETQAREAKIRSGIDFSGLRSWGLSTFSINGSPAC